MLTDFDIGVGLPLLADSVCVCVCVILLVFHSCRDVVTTIILTAREKELKIELKVQRKKCLQTDV